MLRREDREGNQVVVALEDSARSVGYTSLAHTVDAITAALTRRGVRRGDRVAVALPNSVTSVEIFLACGALGAIWVGVNPTAPILEKSRQFGVVTPRVVIADNHAELPDGVHVVDATSLIAEATEGGHTDPLPRPDPDAPCVIAFTSGTTGTPKAIVHSRAGLSLVAASLGAATVRRTDRVGVTLPLSIHNVMIVGPLAALFAGATTVVLDRLNARGVAAACRDRRLSMVRALVPATVYDLVHDGEIAPDSLASLREAGCGAAGLPESLRDAFEAKFGVRLVGSYGLSEAPAAVCHEGIACPRQPGASGTPLPHVSISVRDPAGASVPTGIEGEVWVGPAPDGQWANQYRPALGMWVDGELTAADQKATWFSTGDVGSIDHDGALHISARKTDVITRGGVTVNAVELETVLGELAGVREAAVVGRAHPRLGERIVAFVELESGALRHAESLGRDASGVLSHGKVPDEFVIVGALPRNAMGKVSRPDLLALLPQESMRE